MLPSALPRRAARVVSILGHPLLVLPAAVALVLLARAGDWRALLPLAVGFAGFAAALMAYSWWQVKRRRWAHIDASQRAERRGLNRLLLGVLAVAAGLTWHWGNPESALGLALAATMVAVALATSRHCTLSLHVAFAVFAACLLVQLGPWPGTGGLVFAALVAWSRLQLARHAPRDLVAGALAGAGAGAAFWTVMAMQGT